MDLGHSVIESFATKLLMLAEALVASLRMALLDLMDRSSWLSLRLWNLAYNNAISNGIISESNLTRFSDTRIYSQLLSY